MKRLKYTLLVVYLRFIFPIALKILKKRHGRNNQLIEAEFFYNYIKKNKLWWQWENPKKKQ